jgi:hypothetical protein
MQSRTELAPSVLLCIPSALKRHATPFNRTMGLALVILLAAELLVAKAVGLGSLWRLLSIWPGLVLLVGVLLYCVLRPLPRLIESCELAIWAGLLTNILALLIQIAGRSPRPLVDHWLANIDARMHFSTSLIVHHFAKLPLLQICSSNVYALLPVLIVGAILLPPFFGHPAALRRFLLSVVLAAILTAASSALWPAAGPWTTECLTPTKDQAAVTAYLMRLKSAAPVDLDMQDAGIVSLPSFHVVLAVLSALALSSILRLRGWAWSLVGLICISTVTTGWHYGIDVVAGLIFAIVSFAAASRIPLSTSAIP